MAPTTFRLLDLLHETQLMSWEHATHHNTALNFNLLLYLYWANSSFTGTAIPVDQILSHILQFKYLNLQHYDDFQKKLALLAACRMSCMVALQELKDKVAAIVRRYGGDMVMAPRAALRERGKAVAVISGLLMACKLGLLKCITVPSDIVLRRAISPRFWRLASISEALSIWPSSCRDERGKGVGACR